MQLLAYALLPFSAPRTPDSALGSSVLPASVSPSCNESSQLFPRDPHLCHQLGSGCGGAEHCDRTALSTFFALAAGRCPVRIRVRRGGAHKGPARALPRPLTVPPLPGPPRPGPARPNPASTDPRPSRDRVARPPLPAQLRSRPRPRPRGPRTHRLPEQDVHTNEPIVMLT